MVKFKGIDVSKHNGKIDWQKVKNAGIQFAIIRAGFGSDMTSQDDPFFEENVKGAESVEIPWGAYLYSYALTVEQAKSEAAHVLRLLKGKKPSYPVAFDMEDADKYKERHGMPPNHVLIDICYTFLDIVEKAGYYVGLYASLSWFKEKLNDPKLDRFDKWVAQWGPKCTYWKPYGMWQYTNQGTVAGISGPVDMNIAYNDYPTIIKNAGLNGWEKPAAEKPKEEPKLQPKSKQGTYTIKSGDTFWELEKKNGWAHGTLEELNPGVDPRKLKVGQKIKIPSGSKNQSQVKPSGFKVGQKVRVKKSAQKYATGQNIPEWVKGKTYTIQQVKSDRVLLKEILSWVYKKDVE